MSWLGWLVRATHPLPALAVTAFVTGTCLAAGVGARSGLVAAAVLAGQASVGWSNDWIDAGRDATAGRREKPTVHGVVTARQLRAAALGAAVACVPLSFALGVRAGVVHLTAVGAAWAYNAGLKATVLSFLPYLIAFGLVPPVFVAALLPGADPRPALVIAGGLLGVAAHFVNTVPDEAADALTAVRGLPQRLGPTRSVLGCTAMVIGASVLLAVGGGTGAAAGGVAAVALAVTAALAVRAGERSRLSFRLVIAAVAALVIGVVASGDRMVARPRHLSGAAQHTQ